MNFIDESILNDIYYENDLSLSKQLSTPEFYWIISKEFVISNNIIVIYNAYLGQGCRLYVVFDTLTNEYVYSSSSHEENKLTEYFRSSNWQELRDYVLVDCKKYS